MTGETVTSLTDEIARLRAAIEQHRDDICATEDCLRGADLDLWLTLRDS
jgi:hypothetical protein